MYNPLEGVYNYHQHVLDDCIEYVKEHVSKEDLKEHTANHIFDELYDDMFVDDSVTGNASGSYTCNAFEAGLMLAGNFGLLVEAFEEFGCEFTKNFSEEYADVTIRCYLLSQMLPDAIKILQHELEE